MFLTIVWKMFAPQLMHIRSRSRQYGVLARADFFTSTQAVANLIENTSRAWKITSRYPLLHVNRFRHRRSWNAKIYREKMLGMKNHFDISDSIDIREVDIAGVACNNTTTELPCKYIYIFFCQLKHGCLETEKLVVCNSNWATTWQNQQNEWAPSEDSDQPGHPPSLIRVFIVRRKKALATHSAHSEDSDQTGRMPRLIWVFAGRTAILLVLSCRGSIISCAGWRVRITPPARRTLTGLIEVEFLAARRERKEMCLKSHSDCHQNKL